MGAWNQASGHDTHAKNAASNFTNAAWGHKEVATNSSPMPPSNSSKPHQIQTIIIIIIARLAQCPSEATRTTAKIRTWTSTPFVWNSRHITNSDQTTATATAPTSPWTSTTKSEVSVFCATRPRASILVATATTKMAGPTCQTVGASISTWLVSPINSGYKPLLRTNYRTLFLILSWRSWRLCGTGSPLTIIPPCFGLHEKTQLDPLKTHYYLYIFYKILCLKY